MELKDLTITMGAGKKKKKLNPPLYNNTPIRTLYFEYHIAIWMHPCLNILLLEHTLLRTYFNWSTLIRAHSHPNTLM